MSKRKKGILITRPLPQGAALARLAAQSGYFAHVFPTMMFEPVPVQVTLPLPQTVVTPILLIITSQQALAHAPAFLLSQLRQLAEANKLVVIALGNATAQTALAHHLGAQLVAPNGADSEWLLAHPLLTAVEGRLCVVLTGQQGRGLLATVLQERHAKLQLVEVYRQVCPKPLVEEDWPSLQKKIQIVIATSFQGVLNLFSLVPAQKQEWLHRCSWVVPSERVKKLANSRLQIDPNLIYVSQGASHQAILKILEAIDPF